MKMGSNTPFLLLFFFLSENKVQNSLLLGLIFKHLRISDGGSMACKVMTDTAVAPLSPPEVGIVVKRVGELFWGQKQEERTNRRKRYDGLHGLIFLTNSKEPFPSRRERILFRALTSLEGQC